jgi:hypothetical protein
MLRIAELHDSKHVLARADLSMKTADLLKWAHQTLKDKGFERTHAGIASAMFEWRYQRDGRHIVLDGWHGTGKKGTCRHFGDLKLCFSLYDDQKVGRTEDNKYSPALKLDHNDIVPAAIRFMDEIRDYIKRL